jgi:hypothetical protein
MKLRESSEKDIEDYIIKWINLQYQCFAFKMDVKANYDPKIKAFRKLSKNVPKGGSDVIVFARKYAGVLEIKTPSEWRKFYSNPGPHELNQQGFLAKVKATGNFAQCVCSVDQVIELFKTLRIIP